MTARGPLITRSDDRAWGVLVFAGTRDPVVALFEYLEAGESLEKFLRQFPAVTREHAIAVLESARTRVRDEAVPV